MKTIPRPVEITSIFVSRSGNTRSVIVSPPLSGREISEIEYETERFVSTKNVSRVENGEPYSIISEQFDNPAIGDLFILASGLRVAKSLSRIREAVTFDPAFKTEKDISESLICLKSASVLLVK